MPAVIEYQPLIRRIEQINDAMTDTNLMTVAYKRNTSRLGSRWVGALKIEPPSANQFYPIHWASEKQRRAFFATNGFGRGIPTQRTHALSQGWKYVVASVEKGGELRVYNANPETDFVYGNFDTERQPMFEGSSGGIPWLEPFEVSVPFMDEAEFILAETFHTIMDERAGVV